MLDKQSEIKSLEKEFSEALNLHKNELKEIMDDINKNIKKLEEIAKKNGLPFRLIFDFDSVTKLYYHPSTYVDKWVNKKNKLEELDESYEVYDNIFNEIYSLGGNSLSHEGWHYSYVC